MNTKRFQKLRMAILTLSTILFPVTFYYLSPVIPIGASITGIVTGSIIVFLAQMVTAVVIGRSFCSWLCPAGGIQDQVAFSRTRRVPVRKIGWIKYFVWGVWLVMLVFFFRRAGGIQDIQFAFATEGGLSTTSVQALIVYAAVTLVFFLLSLTIGRRAGCHILCWMAPFMVIGRRIGLHLHVPSLRLKTKPEVCVSCRRCDEGCPMSLDVMDLVSKGEIYSDSCILCGKCIDTCRKDVISWRWAMGHR